MEKKIERYQKKPIVIEALQWTGDIGAIVAFGVSAYLLEDGKSLQVFTLEGGHIATMGDWIIKGVKGEFYPCKPDIFQQTYTLYSDPPSPVCEKCGQPRGSVHACPFPPSPEPPEKVRETIAEEIEYACIDGNECPCWEYGCDTVGHPNNTQPCKFELLKADSIILKLQQAGWGDLKSYKAEVRQQALKEVKSMVDLIDKENVRENWSDSWESAIDEINKGLIKLQGELPKE